MAQIPHPRRNNPERVAMEETEIYPETISRPKVHSAHSLKRPDHPAKTLIGHLERRSPNGREGKTRKGCRTGKQQWGNMEGVRPDENIGAYNWGRQSDFGPYRDNPNTEGGKRGDLETFSTRRREWVGGLNGARPLGDQYLREADGDISQGDFGEYFASDRTWRAQRDCSDRHSATWENSN